MVQLKQYIANPLVLILVITAGGLMLAGRLWDRYRATLQQQPAYLLSEQNFRITDAPEWLPKRAHEEIIRQSISGPRSLLAPDLLPQVAEVLRRHSWIEQIVELRKTPVELRIDVRFGKPLLVELPEDQIAVLDPRGEAMDPTGFSAEMAEKLLRIAAEDLICHPVKTGQPWPDRRVTQAVELARHLGPIQDLGNLAGIYGRYLLDSVPAAHGSQPQTLERHIEFRLWTVGRNEIIWGSPVGQESPGEASAAEKIAGLAQFVRLHGPIDQRKDLPTAWGNVLDLRTGELVVVRNAKQASEFGGQFR
jgi:hypothetical protein